MNKKVLGTALLAGLAIGMSSTAFAEEATVQYEKLSTFTLSIPSSTSIDTENGATMRVGVSTWDIAATKTLTVSIGGATANPALNDSGVLTLTNTASTPNAEVTTQMKHVEDTSLLGKTLVTVVGAGFNDNPADAKTELLTLAPLNAEGTRAGTYTATLTFVGQVTP